MAFLTSQSCPIHKSSYTGGAQKKDFGAVSQMGLTRSLVPSVVQANISFKLVISNQAAGGNEG